MMSPQLSAHVARAFERIAERAPEAAALLDADPARRTEAAQVFAASDFVPRVCGDDADVVSWLFAGALAATRSLADYRELVAGCVQSADSDAALVAALRRTRHREMVRIAWRDLARRARLEDTLRETSDFAHAAIEVAAAMAARNLQQRHGTPAGGIGPAQSLIVLGMGKLGGGELNFSSDIDLVLLYPGGGETSGPRAIENEEFYTRQGRELIRLLGQPTHDGRVFRVDMRLRPFGDSGPLVSSFASFEDYLQLHGRDWERYAYVKARAMTSHDQFGEVARHVLRPFVYRRYLDFGVFESLREMKGLIEREVERRELADHVKLGPGGIREIEFVVQAFQLIRGGQDRQLREPSLLTVLPRLEGAKLLPADAVAELGHAYRFLRRVENRLQMLDDQQAHLLPTDELAQERLARAMDCADFAALRAELDIHRANVTRHFDAVVLAPAAPTTGAAAPLPWDGEGDPDALVARLAGLSFADPREVVRIVEEARAAPRLRRLDAPGRKRLDALLGRVLTELPAGEAGQSVLRRLLQIFEAIGQRSAYFALLLENGAARARLVEICAHGAFLAQQIASHPLLLDELLDAHLMDTLPTRGQLAAELAHRVADVADEEPERQVEALVRFQRAAVFRVAVADLTGRMPVMHVSDRLTEIAELIVEEAMRLAWLQMTALLGVPQCRDADDAPARAVRIAAIGYGKLGGRELGYASDLDLVFIHDSRGAHQETAPQPESPRGAVDNQVFFTRFAQRLMHLLTVHSSAGRLYEVDVRLRPSGKGGMLITQIDALLDYQRKEAWTWEHQALLHARAVAGDAGLRGEFETLRMQVLTGSVRRDTLATDVRDMRDRMRRELSAGGPDAFDVKQDRGGIADIEFLAQYWALHWAQRYPAVAMFSDTIRQLESVASADLVPQSTVDVLTGVYRRYREVLHHRALEGSEGPVPAVLFVEERRKVAEIWEASLGSIGAAPAPPASPL